MNKMLQFDQKLDATGLACPLPILRAKKALANMQSGEVLFVIATDGGSIRDFEAFAKQTGHILEESNTQEENYYFWLRKS